MKSLHSPRVSFIEIDNGTAHVLCDNGAHYTWRERHNGDGTIKGYWKELTPVPHSVRSFELEQGEG
jgi:hypothetical protein